MPTALLTLTALVIAGAPAGFTVIAKVAVPMPAPSVAVMVALEIPITVGVPEISPVAVLMDNPLGRPVAL